MKAPQPSTGQAKFLSGSTMRHIVVMTASASAGLFAIFAADFINIFYLNQLGQVEVAAAAGYATTLFFFLISFGIGLSIAATALIAPALGANDMARAKRLTWNVHIFTFAATLFVAALLWPFLGSFTAILGATGKTQELAVTYLQIVVPSTAFLTTGMVSAAVLRSVGDARRSMWVTLFGAIATMILDPIFIFGFGLGIEGAAIASSIARFVLMMTGIYGVRNVHNMLSPDTSGSFWADTRALGAVAIPAVITNVASPFANAYVTGAIAPFGDEAISGWTIVSRLIPVAFVGIFALTGSVAPIIGQNLGARNFTRVRSALNNALLFTAIYTSVVWLILAISYSEVATLMKAQGQARELMRFFCLWLTPLFGFMGVLFIANAGFNNLGRPQFAAYLNWGRATIGTIPLVMIGATYSAKGVLLAQMLGAIGFGLLAIFLCFRYVDRLERKNTKAEEAVAPKIASRWWFWPASTPRA